MVGVVGTTAGETTVTGGASNPGSDFTIEVEGVVAEATVWTTFVLDQGMYFSSKALIRSSKAFEGDLGDLPWTTAAVSETSEQEEVSRDLTRGLFSVESRSLVVTSLPFESVLRSLILFGGRGHGEKLFIGLVMLVFFGEGSPGLTMRAVSPGTELRRALAAGPNLSMTNSGNGSFITFLGEAFEGGLSLEEETSQACSSSFLLVVEWTSWGRESVDETRPDSVSILSVFWPDIRDEDEVDDDELSNEEVGKTDWVEDDNTAPLLGSVTEWFTGVVMASMTFRGTEGLSFGFFLTEEDSEEDFRLFLLLVLFTIEDDVLEEVVVVVESFLASSTTTAATTALLLLFSEWTTTASLGLINLSKTFKISFSSKPRFLYSSSFLWTSSRPELWLRWCWEGWSPDDSSKLLDRWRDEDGLEDEEEELWSDITSFLPLLMRSTEAEEFALKDEADKEEEEDPVDFMTGLETSSSLRFLSMWRESSDKTDSRASPSEYFLLIPIMTWSLATVDEDSSIEAVVVWR